MVDSNRQFGLLSLLLVGAATPIWIWLIVTLPFNPGFGDTPTRFVITPFVLTGITVAIHRLIRKQAHAWPISIFASPLVARLALMTASLLAGKPQA